MIIDLPDTTTEMISRRLVGIREDGGAVMIGRVLTLVVVTDEVTGSEESILAANDASREHPCRVIAVIRGDRAMPGRLDAQIRVGGDAGASEVIVLRLQGDLAEHGASVITPLLLPDTPVVAWWPRHSPTFPSRDRIGRLAVRRLADADADGHPSDALAKRRRGYEPGDTDLAWSRLSHWRSILTSMLDQPPYGPIIDATVAGPESMASVDLAGGWLASRLGIDVHRSVSRHPLVVLERPDERIVIRQIDRKTALVSRTGHPDARVVLSRRRVADCLAEELRMLHPDPVYAEALDGLSRVIHTAASTR